jgi:hypothetical protein
MKALGELRYSGGTASAICRAHLAKAVRQTSAILCTSVGIDAQYDWNFKAIGSDVAQCLRLELDVAVVL